MGREARPLRRALEVALSAHRYITSKRAALIAGRAFELRRQPTWSEQILWNEIRGNKLGVSFKRQVPLGGRFIADFVAPSARLVVEVDGGYHQERRTADARRQRVLERLGYRVLRLEAALVLGELAVALARIRQALAAAG